MAAVLVGMLVVNVVVHLRQLHAAPYLDEGDFVSSGYVLSRGGLFYVDTWNERGPLVYYQTALLFLVAPPSLETARIYALFLSIVQMLLVFELARRWFGPVPALAASATYVAWHPIVMGLFYLPEHTSGVLTLAVMLLLFTSRERLSPLRFVVAGIVLSCMAIDKQTAAVLALGVCGYVLAGKVRTSKGGVAIVPLAVGLVVPWVILAIPYIGSGEAGTLLWGLFFPLLEYRHEAYVAVARDINPALYAPLVLAIGGFVATLFARRRAFAVPYAIWLIAAAVTSGPSFFAHHALILLLPASVAVAGLIDSARRGPTRPVWVAYLIVLVIGSIVAARSTTDWREKTMTETRWQEIDRVASFIANNTRDDDRIWVFPHESNLYLFSGRRSAVRFPFLLPWTASPRVIDEITASIEGDAPPALVVYTNFYVDTSPGLPPAEFAAPVIDALVARYRVAGASPSGLVVLEFAPSGPTPDQAVQTRRVLTAKSLPSGLPRIAAGPQPSKSRR